MVHSEMNEPLIIPNWVWGLGVKQVNQERESSCDIKSGMQTSSLNIYWKIRFVATVICKPTV